jgi:diguanylate cyclase (GGDEF)-like protein
VASRSEKSRGRAYKTYLYAVGVVCTGFFITLQTNPALFNLTRSVQWTPFLILLVFGISTRFLSFRAPLHQVTVSLDIPVYLTSILTVGTVNGGLIVYMCIGYTALSRMVTRFRNREENPKSWFEHFGYFLFLPGMTATVMISVAMLFGVDSELGRLFDGGPKPYWFIPLVGMVFIGLQYFLASIQYVLRGISWSRIGRDVIAPALAAEVPLLPLAVLAVLIYNRTSPNMVPFMLLVGSYLFVNYVVKRLSEASAALSKRVGELEALNRLSKGINSTLDTPELINRVARETLDIFPHAAAFVLSSPGAVGSTKSRMEVYDRKGQLPEDFPMKEAAKVVNEGRVKGAPMSTATKRGTWLIVPVVGQGDSLGSIALWNPKNVGFQSNDLPFLSTIAGQAAVAFENARLYELATVDSLTGLYIRRYFNARLAEEFERTRRYGGSCSLILADIDWLKFINDSYGHPVGDRVLCQVARVIRDETRLVDIPARLGGDEFAILLPNLAAEQAIIVAERVRAAVASIPIIEKDRPLTVTVSMGIAVYPGHGAKSPEELITASDKALYKAKLAPQRNQVVMYIPDKEATGAG